MHRDIKVQLFSCYCLIVTLRLWIILWTSLDLYCLCREPISFWPSVEMWNWVSVICSTYAGLGKHDVGFKLHCDPASLLCVQLILESQQRSVPLWPRGSHLLELLTGKMNTSPLNLTLPNPEQTVSVCRWWHRPLCFSTVLLSLWAWYAASALCLYAQL